MLAGHWYLVFIMVWSHPIIDNNLWFFSKAECEAAGKQIRDGVREAFDLTKGNPFVTCVYQSR
jgi:hypothetical protein